MSGQTVLAAGGVLWRNDPADPEIALVHRPHYDDWSLPKGKVKPGEHLLVTALREVSEETGYHPRIGPYLTAVSYPVTSGGHPAKKVVTYWSMRCCGGAFLASREVDEMQWLPLDKAARLVSSPLDRDVLHTFAVSRWDTDPLLLVRHGATAAQPRRLVCPHDEQKLNRSGRDRASSLVPVLVGIGVSNLLSADQSACVDTLAPFAAASGLTVRREAHLTRAGFAGNEMDVADQVRRDAASSQALVVCGGQRVVTGLLHALGRWSDVRPPSQTTVKKAGWWILHHRNGAISAYEKHEAVT